MAAVRKMSANTPDPLRGSRLYAVRGVHSPLVTEADGGSHALSASEVSQARIGFHAGCAVRVVSARTAAGVRK